LNVWYWKIPKLNNGCMESAKKIEMGCMELAKKKKKHQKLNV
jgi:hypothetical protein